MTWETHAMQGRQTLNPLTANAIRAMRKYDGCWMNSKWLKSDFGVERDARFSVHCVKRAAILEICITRVGLSFCMS